MAVRFELTTDDPWSVDDAICEGISPLGYWQKVNQSPTQTKPYNTGHYAFRFSSCTKRRRILPCITPNPARPTASEGENRKNPTKRRRISPGFTPRPNARTPPSGSLVTKCCFSLCFFHPASY